MAGHARDPRLQIDPRLQAAGRVLGRGLLVGLALLGAGVCAAALRLSTVLGLLLLAAATTVGLLVLAGHAGLRRLQARRLARGVAGEAEAWLRQSPGRSEDAG